MSSPASHFAASAVCPTTELATASKLARVAADSIGPGTAFLSLPLSLTQCANVTKAEAVDLILSDELLHFRKIE